MGQRDQNVGTQKDLALYRIQTAKSTLDAEEYRGANNRAYYAAFYAINAVHALEGNSYKRHKDAIGNFNKNFVKTGIFPKEIGRKVSEIEEIRHASDYDDFYIASKEESVRQIAVADELIQLVEKYYISQVK